MCCRYQINYSNGFNSRTYGGQTHRLPVQRLVKTMGGKHGPLHVALDITRPDRRSLSAEGGVPLITFSSEGRNYPRLCLVSPTLLLSCCPMWFQWHTPITQCPSHFNYHSPSDLLRGHPREVHDCRFSLIYGALGPPPSQTAHRISAGG